jgi:hypothetical protein
MLGGDFRIAGQIKLAHAAPMPPITQQHTKWLGRCL